MNPDAINGLFEGLGSLAIWQNVKALLRHRQVRGVSLLPTAFFTAWGIWNLFYYPALQQWWSFLGGCSIVVANAFWLGLAWRFRGG